MPPMVTPLWQASVKHLLALDLVAAQPAVSAAPCMPWSEVPRPAALKNLSHAHRELQVDAHKCRFAIS
jgi:hypothetical protein